MRGLRTGLLALVTFGWLAPAAFGEMPDDNPVATELSQDDWLVRTARIEGAAANVREAAAAVKRTADGIGQAGRLVELARLSGEAHLLEKKVIGLRLSAEVLAEPIAP